MGITDFRPYINLDRYAPSVTDILKTVLGIISLKNTSESLKDYFNAVATSPSCHIQGCFFYTTFHSRFIQQSKFASIIYLDIT